VTVPSAARASSPDTSDGISNFLRFRRWRYRARRSRLGWRAGLVVATLFVGIAIGRWTAPPDDGGARRMLEDQVMPLALDADSIWTSASDGAPPVSEALVALQRDGDPTVVLESAGRWLRSYDTTIGRMAALELPSDARPVQRQFVAAVSLSRDAVEVLHRAARIDQPGRRQGLLTEVGRLRVRGEQLTQSARASILDVAGHDGEVTPLPPLPSFPDPDEPPAD
jgi:hypothetical protein